MKQLVRFFECGLTGDKLAIIRENGKQEKCVTEDEGYGMFMLPNNVPNMVANN